MVVAVEESEMLRCHDQRAEDGVAVSEHRPLGIGLGRRGRLALIVTAIVLCAR